MGRHKVCPYLQLIFLSCIVFKLKTINQKLKTGRPKGDHPMSRKKINLSNHPSLFYTKAIEATIIGLIILVPIIIHPRCITVFGPAKEFTFEALVIIGLMFWV
jgi:hypothetical protein